MPRLTLCHNSKARTITTPLPIFNSTVPALPAFSRTLNLLNQFPQRVYPEDTHINHNNHDNYNALGTGNHATHITITRNVDSIIGDVNGDYCDCLAMPLNPKE